MRTRQQLSLTLASGLLGSCSLVLAGLGGGCGRPAPPEGPIVILIVVDTLRADLGGAQTPSIDRLAADGVSFGKAFSHAPMTLPAHTSLFSSRPPAFTGVLNNRQEVHEDLPLFAEWLAEHGYGTHAVISLGTMIPRGESGALSRGFDRFDCDFWHQDPAPGALARMRASLDGIDASDPFFFFAHFTDPHSPFNAHGARVTEADVLLDGRPVESLTTSDMTRWNREHELTAGRHVLEVRSDRPFYLHDFRWSHDGDPLEHTWETGALNERANEVKIRAEVPRTGASRFRLWIAEALDWKTTPEHYRREVEFLDAHLGELLDELDRRGLYDDSIIVFTSDHGEALGEHGLMGQHVHNLHDELLHVPLIVKLPAGHPARERLALHAAELVPHQDLVPTILALTGLPALPGQVGQSLLIGRTPELFAQTHKPASKRNLLALRNGSYKLIHDPDEGSFRMFDLQEDPGELTDVFAEQADRLPEGWTERLGTLAATVADGPLSGGDPLPETTRMLEALGYAGGDEAPPGGP